MPSSTRRQFLSMSTGTAAVVSVSGLSGILLHRQAPAVKNTEYNIPYGVQAGDISGNRAIIWSRAERDAMMHIEWSTNENFSSLLGKRSVAVLADSDFTGKTDLTGLPMGQKVFYRVHFKDLHSSGGISQPVIGSIQMPPVDKQDIRFVWGGDTAGQGYGINPQWGGMRIYETMRQVNPHFFIHSGDTIYADGPMQERIELSDGTFWHNIVTESKSKVAESLQEFRDNFGYNLLDKNVRAFNSEVPMFAQWDDHEVVNNWYPGEILDDSRYKIKSVDLLAARGKRAFMEYMPVRQHTNWPDRLYAHFNWGPQLDIFRIDLRSYRGKNSKNRQTKPNNASAFLGQPQIAWLKNALKQSTATWKVIASDMPIGLLVRDGDKHFENGANGDGPVLGREQDIAELLRFMRDNQIHNVIWLTADVHYTAAHFYDADKAQFQDFNSFWEFISGPLNAGTFGPGDLDNTFGPQVMYYKAPQEGQQNLPPSAGLQFFGQVDINAESEHLTVTLKDVAGNSLYTKTLEPVIAENNIPV